jgi:UTP--glucose-1-phosphate uridylyltransferase
MEETNKYGVIAGNLVDGTDNTYRVTDMVEKPDPKDAPTNMAIIGRYILTPDIFDIIRNTEPGKAVRSRLPMPCLNRQNREMSLLTNLKANASTAVPSMVL